jgi:putative toxin-antitoxin system antitoxin component (TIGR02293 family)
LLIPSRQIAELEIAMSAVLEAPCVPESTLEARAQAHQARLLGLARPPRSALEWSARIAKGLSPAVMDAMVRAGLPSASLAFVIPPRTLSHRKARGEALTADESDRAARAARVLALALAVFGVAPAALEWLRRPLKVFEGQAALDLLPSESGARFVEESLARIDEGYFA